MVTKGRNSLENMKGTIQTEGARGENIGETSRTQKPMENQNKDTRHDTKT